MVCMCIKVMRIRLNMCVIVQAFNYDERSGMPVLVD